MGYTIGVSSGVWSIAKNEGKGNEYLTVMKKIFWGSQKGVNFTQMDLETINEFTEPHIEDQIKRVREMGLRFGLHGETSAYAGEHTMALETAIKSEYELGHDRFITHINGAGKWRSEYVNSHASELKPIPMGYQDFKPAELVDFWGRPLYKLFEDVALRKWILRFNPIWEISRYGITDIKTSIEEDIKQRIQGIKEREENKAMMSRSKDNGDGDPPELKIPENVLKDIRESVENSFIDRMRKDTSTTSMTYGPEKTAYMIVAKWMELNDDPIWKLFGLRGVSIDDIHEDYARWVPPVAAKYIWGHFYPKDEHKFPDPKPLLEKFNLTWTFESEMAKFGYEKHMRIASPTALYKLIKAIDHDKVAVCIDVEHTLSAGFDPMEEANNLPMGAGEKIKLMHVGWPTPHIPAHVPIPVGSDEQLYVYKLLYILRQKGMKNAWIIFERAGGEDPIQESVLSLRLIVKYLEKDVKPEELPPEFFGQTIDRLKRQQVSLKEHFLDPLKGTLQVSEEDYGFLSTTAVQKGKGEDWKKRQYR